MSEGTSVGVISLDLVIKNRISEQLEETSSAIRQSLNAPMQKAADEVTKTTSAAADNIDKAMSRATESVKKNTEKSFGKVREQMQETMQKAREALKFEVSDDPVERIEQEFENTTEKLDLLQKKWQQLQDGFANAETDEAAAKLSEQLNRVESQIMSLTSRSEQLSSKLNGSLEDADPDFSSFGEKMKFGLSEVWEGCKQVNKAAASEIGSFLIAPFKGIKNTIIAPFAAAKNAIVKSYFGLKHDLEYPIDAFKRISSKAFSSFGKISSKAFGKFRSVAGKAVDSIRSKFAKLHGSVGGMTKPLSKFGNTLKNAAKRIFVMAGVLAVFKAMRSALTEAANGNEEFAKSLNEVKANIGVAFQPIISAVMPALNSLMAALAKATKYVAAFVSELFGTTYQKSLETVKQVKGVAKEAQKASTHLASFDEMNVISSSSDSSSSGSDDESGVDYSALDGSDVKLPDWAQRMKDAISGGDWAGVGSLLAEKVNGALNSIDWDALKKKVVGAVSSITDALNGFFGNLDWSALGKDIGESVNTVFLALDTFLTGFDFKGFGTGVATTLNNAIKTADWKLIGKTLADKWNALIDGLYGFVTTFDWSGFGDSLAESVNSWFDTINWAELGQTLSDSVKGVLDTVIHFLEGVDWKGVGEKLWTFIKNIDWGGIAAKAAEAIGAAFGAAAALIWGFIKDAWSQVVGWWKENAYKDGKFTITGLLNGILDKLKGIGTWIKEKIFQPFIKGFKKAFGIASPSKEMSEQGGFIMDGLKNGVVAKISSLIEKFKGILKDIKNVFADIGEWFGQKFSSAWSKIKQAFSGAASFFSGVLLKIKTVFAAVPQWFSQKFSDAWLKIKKVFSGVSTFFTGVLAAIKNVFLSIPKWFKEKFTDAWQNVKNVFSKGGKIFSGIKEGIESTFKTVVNGLISGINTVISFPFNKINGMLNKIHDISIMGVSPFEDLWDRDPLPVPQIPKLANGGLVTAPTLAMVGDNKNARNDPEVVAPLSKLSAMIGRTDDQRIIELLLQIIALLRGGQHIDLYLKGRRESRLIAQEVIDEINDIIRTTGTVPIMI